MPTYVVLTSLSSHIYRGKRESFLSLTHSLLLILCLDGVLRFYEETLGRMWCEYWFDLSLGFSYLYIISSILEEIWFIGDLEIRFL